MNVLIEAVHRLKLARKDVYGFKKYIEEGGPYYLHHVKEAKL